MTVHAEALPIISIVVARAANDVIGANNGLPWHLPDDLAHFKRVTMGKPIIMGRRTFDSIGRALPGRRNIVVTRDATWVHVGCERAGSLEQALQLCAGIAEVAVIGGAQLYAAALPIAQRAYVTEIHHEYEGDTLLPPLGSQWHEVSRERRETAQGLRFDFAVYERA